jgi:hypothetical protein
MQKVPFRRRDVPDFRVSPKPLTPRSELGLGVESDTLKFGSRQANSQRKAHGSNDGQLPLLLVCPVA